VKEIDSLQLTGCDTISIHVAGKLSYAPTLVHLIYRPPRCNVTNFCAEMDTFLHNLDNNFDMSSANTIILGDFNVDFTLINDTISNHDADKLNNIFSIVLGYSGIFIIPRPELVLQEKVQLSIIFSRL